MQSVLQIAAKAESNNSANTKGKLNQRGLVLYDLFVPAWLFK